MKASVARRSGDGGVVARRDLCDLCGLCRRPGASARTQAPRDAGERVALLRPEALAVAHAFELVAYAGGLDLAIERRAAEHHVPPREQHAEVAAIGGALVAVAD